MKRSGDFWMWAALCAFVLGIILVPSFFSPPASCTQVTVHAESGEINAEVCQ